ncbi:MAG TPA: hypothetical protein VLO09_03375, partial [Ornithinimicrobium sp.]|nr:hypothetical protein [Ornithinimicrobium sp.]
MYQHVDLMVASSMARERERQTQADLRHRDSARGRAPAPRVVGRATQAWWRELLVRAHLVHASLP